MEKAYPFLASEKAVLVDWTDKVLSRLVSVDRVFESGWPPNPIRNPPSSAAGG